MDPSGTGYTDLMIKSISCTDEALDTHDARLYQLMSKVYADLFEKQLLFIHNVKLRALWIQAMEGNRRNEEQVKRGLFNYQSINKFFTAAVNGLNDFLNLHQ